MKKSELKKLIKEETDFLNPSLYFIKVEFKIHESWGDGDIINGIMIAGKRDIIKSYTITKEGSSNGFGYFLAKIYSKVGKKEFGDFLDRFTTRHTEYKIL